ncbi:MAG TPA: type II secretion system protein GspG [Polyangia bacterium]|jgi:hypothetical protein
MIGKLAAILCGVALTWTCAAFGIVGFSELHGHGCGGGAKEARQRVLRLERALNDYVLAYGRCPPNGASLIDSGQIDAQNMIDPWGRDIEYSCSDDAVKVTSAGLDGAFGTPDDIRNEH